MSLTFRVSKAIAWFSQQVLKRVCVENYFSDLLFFHEVKQVFINVSHYLCLQYRKKILE